MDDRNRGPDESDRYGKRPRFAGTGANAEPFVPRNQKMQSNVQIEPPIHMARGGSPNMRNQGGNNCLLVEYIFCLLHAMVRRL